MEEWDNVWSAVSELSELYPDDLVVIGGVAVYLHAETSDLLPIEFTHDVDLTVALAAWGDLRDAYEVVANRRLSKHQLTIGEVEVDLYVERNNTLRVGYEDLAQDSVVIRGVRVASLEHLLLLKLDAAAARWRSAHGAKDRRDLAKILVMLESTAPNDVLAQAIDADVERLDAILGSGVFLELADGNSKAASQLRKRASVFVGKLKALR